MLNGGCAWEARKIWAGAARGIDAASASTIPIAAVRRRALQMAGHREGELTLWLIFHTFTGALHD
jgi:hypothetical protein